MVDRFLAWPIETRLLIVWLLGATATAVVHWAVYSFGYESRPLSPWCRRHPHDDRSRWLDRLPVVGWLRLQRKGKLLGYEFWLRPMIVEIVGGMLLAAFYYWVVENQGFVYPAAMRTALPNRALTLVFHGQFLLFSVLGLFMLAASLIDIDEKTIPDEVTVPGTLIALALAALAPAWRLPSESLGVLGGQMPTIHLASPREFPQILRGSPEPWGLAAALGCYGLWCFALLPRTWRTRRGLRQAWKIFRARIARQRISKWIAAMFAAGSAGIVLAWRDGGDRWVALLSALVGLAVGGLLVWCVRQLGSRALGREAMGFGDVVLLAMIGAYLGWQPAIMVFFLAPFAGLLMGLVQLIVTRSNVLAFGPFLCLAAATVVLWWGPLWDRFYPLFYPGWLVPVAMGSCLVAIPLLLLVFGWIKAIFRRPDR